MAMTIRPILPLLLLAGLVVEAPSAWCQSAQPVTESNLQHVILKSGNVFSGQIEERGAQILVHDQRGATIRLSRDEVDFVTESLETAANRLANRITDQDPNSRIQLAEWCLRYGALDGARRQIAWLEQHSSDSIETRSLLQRWELALHASRSPELVENEQTVPNTPHHGLTRDLPESEPRIATREELRLAVQSLSRESRRGFTSQVHNRIVTGCAAALCHGKPSASMRLWRSQGSRGLDSTAAQRNLHAILGQINRHQPATSPFLKFLTHAHGGLEDPVFRKDSERWKEIRDWVLSTEEVPTPTGSLASGRPAAPADQERIPRPVDLSTAAAPDPVADPFDPDYFNRYHSGQHQPPARPPVDIPPRKSQPLPPVDDSSR